jgi:hypothetical protein
VLSVKDRGHAVARSNQAKSASRNH